MTSLSSRWSRLAVCLLVVAAVGVAPAAAQAPPADADQGIPPRVALLDSYIQFLQPAVALSAQQSGREGRTTVTVTAVRDGGMNPYMPVSSPETQGMTFDVLDTFDALKNMATAFRQAENANQLSTSGLPLFPRTSSAARLASVAADPNEVHTSALAADEPAPLASLVTFPPNLMMVPFGASSAAIADVLDVRHDPDAAAITLQLDVVHDPVVFSQFVQHVPCSIRTNEAHYHFATRPGMEVDAPGLLQSLKETNYKLDGLHVFLKSEPLLSCFTAEFDPTSAELAVGSSLNVTITVYDTCASGPAADGTSARLAITGPGSITATSPDTTGNKNKKLKRIADYYYAYTTNGVAWFVVQATGTGTISVVAADVEKNDVTGSMNITAVATAAKLVLFPHKAYRRCGDPLLLTAVALTSTGVPVPGVTISFAVHGDCTPEYASSAVTDAKGEVKVRMGSRQPGTVVVVAATQGANGIVISQPVYVDFFEQRHDDERSGDYERYEREAAKLAEQRALGAPVSTSN